MSQRIGAVLAVSSLLVLAACQGGNNSTIPNPPTGDTTNVTPMAANEAASSAYGRVPETTNGVRTFIHLPLRNEAELEQLVAQQSTEGSPEYHRWLTPQQFRASYGPQIQDLQNAALALRSEGFTATITSQGIIADAPQAVIEKAFGVRLQSVTAVGRTGMSTLVANRAPTLPAALTKLNAQVIGLAHTQPFIPEAYKAKITTENRYSPVGPYWFDDLKQAYQWPSYALATGKGRTIGILAASDFLNSDYQTYFSHEKLPIPTVLRRPVAGGPPAFNPNSGDSLEVTVDIQQAGGMAPGATLVVYGVPDPSDASFAAAYTAMDEDNVVDIVNSSFGSCELFYTPAYNGGQSFVGILHAFHDLFLQGNSQGITFVASSGDFAARACVTPDFKNAVLGINPLSSDPAVTALGGTNLVTNSIANSLNSSYVSENAFGDPLQPGQGPYGNNGAEWGSGGGKSVIWPKPAYQTLVNTHSATRSNPDLALHMGGCPGTAVQPCGPNRSADVTVFGGGLFGVIGTSLSSPDFAGLQAVREQARGTGREGNVNTTIYHYAQLGILFGRPVFHNSIAGNNGFPSTPGYNFVVGNGTIFGSQWTLLHAGPFAGNPQTPSNP